ncbi:MAG: hypothetical protein HZA90_07220 [Verrucomicrobia bacterium]|nr:hypothetical protein [Verrucomicrobiota bacterium]
MPARELRVEGFGIADFVWISWHSAVNAEEGSGFGMHSRKSRQKQTLLAFELKLRDWHKALAQAYRYRYFADAAFVVLPPATAQIARKFLATFKLLDVGLWSFDKASGVIRKFYTPRPKRPLSGSARERAMAVLAGRLKARGSL